MSSVFDAQYERFSTGAGFLAALDQSGGSTPKALRLYGVDESQYRNETEMFDLIHELRTRIITSPAFTSERVLGAILFEQTVDREINGAPSAKYLWNELGIVPFLKIDKGLAELKDGVQVLKPIPTLQQQLDKANANEVFGTKERSLIKQANESGIIAVVDQQFELADQVLDAGLVPIIEPEVDITAADKADSESILRDQILQHLDALPEGRNVTLKLSLPTEAGFYSALVDHDRVVRVVALSGGYSRDEANALLAKNPGVIASFSRALTEGLTAQQSDDEFNQTLDAAIESIYQASIAG
ncbi:MULTISPECIES: fructose bisphosphate aldolase [unclassified Pseudoclavibacter]|uniref:fructose bisphosphate aldolase n=1 Tax=unclassified Pseudoclavibacter TaxID=2615177 RepID=UPI0013018108|nr:MULTISPECIES: fructose bisphosphate aldolase [unclassified Pseudoclavibacter]KAB1659292.1 fructose bisphosphate aldolase [Pseudoclavibacter sp. CFCC 11306]KAB1662106.1 fructose bisphosphate aldolase [Pseudoclavibacter sp. CFCC 13796]KAB1663844.1 fructose bisphosphate aldolase [Pseudoclavibacter sp. CFCC 13611]KAB1664707.1 fructose bisphosphate aldolase [Pseudoclavibacter sp. CFCC 13611]